MHKKTPRSIITYFYGSMTKKLGKIAQIDWLAPIRRPRSFILARIKHINLVTWRLQRMLVALILNNGEHHSLTIVLTIWISARCTICYIKMRYT